MSSQPPAWFSLTNYEDSKYFTALEWFRELSDRFLPIHEREFVSLNFDETPRELFEQVLQSPIRRDWRESRLEFWELMALRLEKHSYVTESARPIKIMDVIEWSDDLLRNQSKIRGEYIDWEDERWRRDGALDVPESLYLPWDSMVEARFEGVTEAFFFVDLKAPPVSE